MPSDGAVVSQPAGDIDYHDDFAPLPEQSAIAPDDSKFFIHYGWEYFVTDPKSWVSVFDASTGANQVVLADIPGAGGAITIDNFGDLYAGIGYGEKRGLIKRFSIDAVDAAFSSAMPLTWNDGIALNPDNYENNSAAGMFFDRRHFLFVGGNEGLTVFRPDGSSESFDVGDGMYSSVAYNPLNDQFLVMTTDRFFNPVFDVYRAADFLTPFVPGDVNGDGSVNGLDVAPFVDFVVSGLYDVVADMKPDGAINGLDIDPFVAAVIAGGGAVVSAVVPEPSSHWLATCALVAIVGYACRRRRGVVID
jgi:hypothetical protein